MFTISEKLGHIADAGLPIAFDGCHKLYLLPDPKSEEEAREIGYDIHSSAEIHELWEDSCSLRFVSCWCLGGTDSDCPRAEFTIGQFDDEAEAADGDELLD